MIYEEQYCTSQEQKIHKTVHVYIYGQSKICCTSLLLACTIRHVEQMHDLKFDLLSNFYQFKRSRYTNLWVLWKWTNEERPIFVSHWYKSFECTKPKQANMNSNYIKVFDILTIYKEGHKKVFPVSVVKEELEYGQNRT